MALPVSSVPCGTCRLCCIGELVVLHPEHGDDVSAYLTRPVIDPTTGRPAHALLHKENGECFYLAPDGCGIHDRAPTMCSSFSCVEFYERLPRAERRRRAERVPGAAAILARGRELSEAARGL